MRTIVAAIGFCQMSRSNSKGSAKVQTVDVVDVCNLQVVVLKYCLSLMNFEKALKLGKANVFRPSAPFVRAEVKA